MCSPVPSGRCSSGSTRTASFASVELGIWQGRYANVELPWLRWWDSQGNLLLTGDERAELAQQQVERMRQRLEQLAAQLRALGVQPDA